MDENNLNASYEEVVQPQDNGAGTGELTGSQATGRDIENMSDEDFASYIEMAQNGDVSEVQADDAVNSPEADNNAQDDGEQSGDAMPAENVQPYKTFATHEEYQAEFDRVMGERLKKNRADMERLDGLRELAMRFYGGDGDNAINSLINDLRDQNAEKSGVSAEELDSQLRDSADARKYREQMKAQEEQQTRVKEIQERWIRESADLKAVVPDFDFNKAMGNKAFYDNVINGMSVAAAYIAANGKPAAPEQPKRKAIAQNMGMRGASVGKVTPNTDAMTDEEFMDYINRLKG